MEQHQKRDELIELRRRAQHILKKRATIIPATPPDDIQKLICELDTYQIELEIQNEELHHTQQELEKSKQKYLDLYEFAPVGYLSISDKGIILGANLTAANILELSKEALLMQPLTNFIHSEDQDIFYFHRINLLKQSTRQVSELRLLKKCGSAVHVQFESVVKSEIDGKSGEFRTMMIDISDRKAVEQEKDRLEARLRQVHKTEAIGTMAGGIAHDFNNILASILGYVEIIKRNTPSESRSIEVIEKIQKAGNRAKEMIHHILTFSRMSLPTQEYCAINPGSIVKEALKFLRPMIPATIDIHSEIDENCGRIQGDPTEIHQVVMNLCVNAFHAMENKGGTLNVCLNKTVLSENDLKREENLKPGEYVKLTVSDNGSGIKPEIMDKIFDPYFTTKNVGQGSGMGLAVVHSIVKHHGGLIKVTSEVDKGTLFEIFFAKTGKEETFAIKTEVESIPTGTEEILFIDDEEGLVEAWGCLLEDLGYSVTTKTDSMEACQLFRNDPNRFDLVISDLTMPNMSGVELAKQMLEIRRDIPIILCTGYSNIIDTELSNNPGIQKILTKPFKPKELAQCMRKILDKDK